MRSRGKMQNVHLRRNVRKIRYNWRALPMSVRSVPYGNIPDWLNPRHGGVKVDTASILRRQRRMLDLKIDEGRVFGCSGSSRIG